MENLVMQELFASIYKGKKVLLTGHTGFKGSWLSLWLLELGADVMGFSKDIPSVPNHYNLLKLRMKSCTGDITDIKTLHKCVFDFKPDIIFHLAAQSLVRYSYQHTLETFCSNVIGTANVFETARSSQTIKAVVNITSDKAYENVEQDVAYKEIDRMGGYDPYSASKGCAELVANCYRKSFFNTDDFGKNHNVLLASARAGNVIGGGDWAKDRLIPDIITSSIKNEPVAIRNPSSTRPWQHVLEPLSGYLLLGQLLLEGRKEIADGWNFGPLKDETLQVIDVLNIMKDIWGSLQYYIQENDRQKHEATLLRLDCSKANNLLGWYPVWDVNTSISKTASWYKHFYYDNKVVTKEDLYCYIQGAKQKKLCWAV